MKLDFDAMSLTEIIRLQTQLSQVLTRRFEKPLALGFTDIVGSTAYFARFGDEAGRALQQLHHDLLAESIQPFGGRIVDVAGDGAFTCFPDVENAVGGLVVFLERASRENETRARDHRLVVRLGVHFGPVLTDGVIVSGDAVNLCARIASTAEPGELRLSAAALRESPPGMRVRAWPVPPVVVRGHAEPLVLFRFDWRDEHRLPGSVIVRETGDTFVLPRQDLISFGRLRGEEGMRANDVVLALSDKKLEQLVSRFHFELRRKPKEGYVLRPVSRQPTEVDGRLVETNQEAPILPGSIVRLSKAVTLEFKARPEASLGNASPTIEPKSG
ncbi:adenylate/guanylate cyclase domain-containing protein [Polyangium jinanense]|uniref:Adenylate/guanylate cyclase domain-containing protein n=1 Tax=Polyangium jinanense TaxID=2829994 RepID=A0A9X3XHF4_9BACT|nr:adenylate/guanylate cyclase domain-containing protein [Polyangium jinanense]MDC3962346.1 adenylate/guanylate cyclase domain-containing protein [Polyangium jinanense]MDC3989143.1 adenylate/guanylate cyclase domain-containing protein [Polyangium jinanense]